jgi:hypothetical protein
MELSKDVEVVIRYVIPGYTLLLPLALIIYFSNPEISDFAGIIIIVFGFCVGYFLQQTYMLLFEGKSWPFERGGYTSVEAGGRRKIIEEVAKEDRTLTKTQAYNVWEYFIYSDKVSNAMRSRISRSHAFIHSQRTVALACVLGIPLSLTGIPYLLLLGAASAGKILTLFALSTAYLLMAVTLLIKARQIRETLMRFEEFIVKKHWDDIQQILAAAEYLHETGKKT